MCELSEVSPESGACDRRFSRPEKVRKKRSKSPSYVQACSFFLDHGGFATNLFRGEHCPAPGTASTGDKRDDSLPTRYVSAIVSFVIRHPLSSGRSWPGLSGDAVFLKLSKLLNQENAWAHPA